MLKLWSWLQIRGQCPKLSSSTTSTLGKGLAPFPKPPVKVPFLPDAPRGTLSCTLPPAAVSASPPTSPEEQVPSLSQSQESGRVGFVRKLLAARPLIYLPMLSLPSVFILLSAQDKWLPYSAELQRLQSS